MSLRDQDLKAYALLALIGALDLKPIRARIGYLYLAWTPKEAIEKGQMVIVDGSEQINQREAQHYFFTQVYSMIKAELNKMRPGNPKDEPVSIIIYSLLQIPGMKEEIGLLTPLYTSRKLELYIVLQSFSQLAPNLTKKIWSR